MFSGLARSSFLIVALVAIGATAFRVATGPDRAKERRNTARAVCISSGASWIQTGNEEICQRDPMLPAQSKKT